MRGHIRAGERRPQYREQRTGLDKGHVGYKHGDSARLRHNCTVPFAVPPLVLPSTFSGHSGCNLRVVPHVCTRQGPRVSFRIYIWFPAISISFRSAWYERRHPARHSSCSDTSEDEESFAGSRFEEQACKRDPPGWIAESACIQ